MIEQEQRRARLNGLKKKYDAQREEKQRAIEKAEADALKTPPRSRSRSPGPSRPSRFMESTRSKSRDRQPSKPELNSTPKAAPKSDAIVRDRFKAMGFLERSEFYANAKASKI